MKKLAVLGIMLLLAACASNYSSYYDFMNQTQSQGWQYHAKARPLHLINQNRQGEYWAAGRSQYEANQTAVQMCNQYFRTSNCVVFEEGNTNVYYAKIKEQKEANERRILSSAKSRANSECKDLGFRDGSSELADCNLKLFTLYKQEALEEEKIRIAEEQVAAAERQAQAAAAQAQAAQQQAYQSQRRNSQALINQGQRMLSGACTLGINC